MNLNIPLDFERAILGRVASGAYPTSEDVLKACLEGLSLLEAELEQDYEWLKREIQLGIEAGERGEFMWRDEAIESMRAELRRRTGR